MRFWNFELGGRAVVRFVEAHAPGHRMHCEALFAAFLLPTKAPDTRFVDLLAKKSAPQVRRRGNCGVQKNESVRHAFGIIFCSSGADSVG